MIGVPRARLGSVAKPPVTARACPAGVAVAPAGAGAPGRAGRLDPLMGLFNKILHAGEGRKLKSLESLPPIVGGFEPEMQRRSDDELRALTAVGGSSSTRPATTTRSRTHLDDLLPEAFAAVREAGKRTLGQRHFDVQIMGGAALHFGWVAEMKTGEGKTLVATLPAYLNALAGRACTSSR